jgi:ferredoxin
MTHVVTESCINCKFMDCLRVCPVDCFYEGPNFLAIDPRKCIDCTLCVAECPADAIYHESDLPENHLKFIKINAELSRQWDPIIVKNNPPQDSSDWWFVIDKLYLLKK